MVYRLQCWRFEETLYGPSLKGKVITTIDCGLAEEIGRANW